MKKYYTRLEAKQWEHEYFIRIDKEITDVRSFRKWLRENLIGPFKADVSFFSSYYMAHCLIRDDDDAMLFKLKWSGELK